MMPKILFLSTSSGSTSRAWGVPTMLATSTGTVEEGLLTVEAGAFVGVVTPESTEVGCTLAGVGGWRKLKAGTWLAAVQLSMPSFQTRVSAGNLPEAKLALSSDSLIGPFCSLLAA